MDQGRNADILRLLLWRLQCVRRGLRLYGLGRWPRRAAGRELVKTGRGVARAVAAQGGRVVLGARQCCGVGGAGGRGGPLVALHAHAQGEAHAHDGTAGDDGPRRNGCRAAGGGVGGGGGGRRREVPHRCACGASKHSRVVAAERAGAPSPFDCAAVTPAAQALSQGCSRPCRAADLRLQRHPKCAHTRVWLNCRASAPFWLYLCRRGAGR